MSKPLDRLKVAHGDLVLAKDKKAALTGGTLIFDDGASQTFTSDGRRPTLSAVERPGASGR
jgi:hypothetical protein